MSIGKLGTNSLLQTGLPLRPSLNNISSQPIEEAKRHLAEVLGAENPSAIKLGRDKAVQNDYRANLEKPIDKFVSWVDEKQHVAQEATFDVLSGKTDNLNQSILATQEAGIAFGLLLEMRNKLVEGFRELTRMSI